MIPELIYNVSPINKSFKESFKLLLYHISKNYNFDFDFNKITFLPDPDSIRVSSNLKSDWREPYSLYVYVFILSNGVSLVGGYGHNITECNITDKKVCFFWDVNNKYMTFYSRLKNFGIKEIRKIKLEKLNNNDIFEYNQKII